MSVKVKTTALKEGVSKAIKCASNNKMIPLTALMQIVINQHESSNEATIRLTTTDGTTYMSVDVYDATTDGDFSEVVVPVDVFSKLVMRTSTEYITLDCKDNVLNVKGNGTYSIELPMEQDGSPIDYPYKAKKFVTREVSETSIINYSDLKPIYTTCKAALSTAYDIPMYTGYYMGDKTVTTDTYKMCVADIKVFGTPKILYPETVALLSTLDSELVKVFESGNEICFVTDDCAIYSTVMDGVNDYPVEAINGLVNQSFKSTCKLSKATLIGLLDRLTLFVSPTDRNSIQLDFTKDGLRVTSKRSSGTELIEYHDVIDFEPFTCYIDVEMFKAMIKAQVGDVIELSYGFEKAIKMTEGKITQIVALEEMR